MRTCRKCKQWGLEFSRNYRPEEFIEGNPKAPVWLIGINPKNKTGFQDKRTTNDLKRYFRGNDIHPYFHDFETVSQKICENFGNKVAHTDLIKCFSPKWPLYRNFDKNAIIKNCSEYLICQIKKYMPKIIICNGADVSKYFTKAFNILDQNETSAIINVEGNDVVILFSGFIGRIDNYSKKRLGKEFERIASERNVF